MRKLVRALALLATTGPAGAMGGHNKGGAPAADAKDKAAAAKKARDLD